MENTNKIEFARLYSLLSNQYDLMNKQHEMVCKLVERSNMQISSSPVVVKQDVIEVATETLSSPYLPYLPYILIGAFLVMGIVCMYFGAPASDSPGGFGSTVVESTNILGNGKSALNNLSVAADNATSAVAEFSAVLKDAPKLESLENMGDTVVNGTLALKGFSHSVANVAQVADNISGAAAHLSSNLKDISQTAAAENLGDVVLLTTGTAKEVAQTLLNVATSANNASALILDITAASTQTARSFAHSIGDSVSAVEQSLTFKSPVETLDISCVDAEQTVNPSLNMIADVFKKKLEGFSLVATDNLSATYINDATSTVVVIEQSFIPTAAYVLPPSGPILSGGVDLFTGTITQEAQMAALRISEDYAGSAALLKTMMANPTL